MGENALPPLLAALEDPATPSTLTTSLLSVLASFEDPAALTTFLSVLRAAHPDHREMAMRGLSRTKGDLPLEHLLGCGNDTNPGVRKYCARALKGDESPEALRELTRLLADGHFSVRFAAAGSLKKAGRAAEAYLLQVIDNPERYPPPAVDLAGEIMLEKHISQ